MCAESVIAGLTPEIQGWLDEARGKLPAGHENTRYIVCGALALLEQMRETYPLKPDDYRTKGGQAKTSKSLVQRVLRRFGEGRIYAHEGGRTTRKTSVVMSALAKRLNASQAGAVYRGMDAEAKACVVDALQRWIYQNEVMAFFNRRRIEVEIDIRRSAFRIVADILAAAAAKGKAPAVAEHLVGAKLAVKYPKIEIENRPYTGADVQAGRPGDFLVNDTVFHVTVAPGEQVLHKCKRNFAQGFRTVLLTPHDKVVGARQIAETLGVGDHVFIDSIEAFVGRNIEEQAEFKAGRLAGDVSRVLAKYNERVKAVEADLSMLIAIPQNLP